MELNVKDIWKEKLVCANYSRVWPFSLNTCKWGFSGGSDSRESACSAGDLGSNPGSGRSPGGGHGYALQYSCLANTMDREAWPATVHEVTNW